MNYTLTWELRHPNILYQAPQGTRFGYSGRGIRVTSPWELMQALEVNSSGPISNGAGVIFSLSNLRDRQTVTSSANLARHLTIQRITTPKRMHGQSQVFRPFTRRPRVHKLKSVPLLQVAYSYRAGVRRGTHKSRPSQHKSYLPNAILLYQLRCVE